MDSLENNGHFQSQLRSIYNLHKWFGQDVWNADLLHSGCTLPSDGEPLMVWGLISAWKNAGECWEVVSSWIVTAWLQIAQQTWRL